MWVQLDDEMPMHPKLMMAGPLGFALDVAAICYSNRHGLGGNIRREVLPAVLPGLPSPSKVAAKLVNAGRWIVTDDGWAIHDIDDFQPPPIVAEARKEKRRARSTIAAHTRWHVNEGAWSPDCEHCPEHPPGLPEASQQACLEDAKSNATSMLTDAPLPHPLKKTSSSSPQASQASVDNSTPDPPPEDDDPITLEDLRTEAAADIAGRTNIENRRAFIAKMLRDPDTVTRLTDQIRLRRHHARIEQAIAACPHCTTAGFIIEAPPDGTAGEARRCTTHPNWPT